MAEKEESEAQPNAAPDAGEQRGPLRAAPARRGAPDPAIVAVSSRGQGWVVGLMITLWFVGLLLMANYGANPQISVVGPMILTGLYPFIGWVMLRLQNTNYRDQFVDNCYYLGFLFTLTAILVAFMPMAFQVGAPLDAARVVALFGSAVGTTVVGLIFRAILEQSESKARKATHGAENAVAAYAEALIDGTRDIKARFDETHAAMSAVLEATTRHLEKIKEFEAASATRAAGLSEALDSGKAQIAESVSGLKSKVETLESRLEKAAEKAALHMSAMADDLRRAIDDLGGVKIDSASLNAAATEARQVFARANEHMSGLAEGLNESLDYMARATRDLSALAGEARDDLTQKTQREVRDLRAEFAGLYEALQAVVEQFRANLELLRRHLETTDVGDGRDRPDRPN